MLNFQIMRVCNIIGGEGLATTSEKQKNGHRMRRAEINILTE